MPLARNRLLGQGQMSLRKSRSPRQSVAKATSSRFHVMTNHEEALSMTIDENVLFGAAEATKCAALKRAGRPALPSDRSE